eukprot:CAMPEP_0116143456 /NCGR_PEP_ID=MMETSP0329-20121206/15464_1 /TAXON_ID=697910 /ORGANISM="Pseudo-nitzschia arenysensis, Strain B593" /LENGTH=230 /DNA_ID=CAMNT_0003638785 /DNA_START=37 /DNA_END=729 /DNA_ORIENTATION=-
MNDSMISNASEEKPASTSTTATPAAAPAAPSSEAATTPQSPPVKRDDLNGGWILDKSRGEWSMRGYLETLNVPELAIQANEKGESELDTVHVIELNDEKVKITKRSRVNNNLVVELVFGNELVEYLKPDQRTKKQLATTEDPGKHLKIESSLLTVNGMAHVVDIKRLVQEEKGSVLIQELTITNPESQKSHTTTRYFNPKDEPVGSEKTGELGAAMEAAKDEGVVKMETD